MDVTDQCAYLDPLDAMKGCAAPAEWLIGTREDPHDLVEACGDHVGALLVGGRLNYLWPIVRDEDLHWRCRSCGKPTPHSGIDCWHEDGTCLCVECTGVVE